MALHSFKDREHWAVTPPPEELPVEAFPDESEFDVVVIGGGPNGLMCAAYLAKAGVKVLVVERRHEIGGGLATEETLFPGYYTNPHAIYHMMTDYMPALKDFGFGKHGLTFIVPNAQTAAVFKDGSSLLLCRQIEDTKDSIAKFSQKDAIQYGKLMRTWRRVVHELVAPGTYVPPLAPIDMIEAFERTEIGRETLRLTEMSPVEIIDENFEHPRVKALMLYAACMWGLNPTDTGLGFLVPLYIDRTMNKGQCYGGSHKMAGSLSREILGAGGLILDNSEVTRIITEGGVAKGVECFDGRVIRAKAVITSLDPQTTFLDHLDRDVVEAELIHTAENWEWEKWSFFTVSAALTEAPQYACDDPWVNDALMVTMGFETPEELLAQWDRVIGGQLGPSMVGHATTETRYDPTLPRVPGHQVAFFQMHAPYDIEGGWKARHDELVDQTLDTWQQYAPNLTKDKFVLVTGENPTHIEQRLPNMVRGSIKHGDYNALQMGAFRPSDLCLGGKTPIEGLYLCGASSYPGGLVIGGPGYIAANSVAEDLGIEKWWRLPAYVQDYVETYLT